MSHNFPCPFYNALPSTDNSGLSAPPNSTLMEYTQTILQCFSNTYAIIPTIQPKSKGGEMLI
jgi:hypothetical protein